MKPTFFREITLYRYRYIFGYLVFGLLLLAVLLLANTRVPRGLSLTEMTSAVTSVNINVLDPTSSNVIDAPYHLLQKGSIHFLGLTNEAIKLPSVVIGTLTGVGLVLMLRRWFRKNVALMTALITVTSVGFLSLARTGTPDIMIAFYEVLLLLGMTHVLHNDKHRFFWKLFCFSIVALFAYSPFGVYPLAAMAFAGVFHPHVRYRLKQGKLWQHITIAIVVLIVLTPLVIATIKAPSIGLTLVGVDRLGSATVSAVLVTALRSLDQMFNFMHNSVGIYVVPLFGIATTILILLGILKLLTARYSARSHMLFTWLILLIPVILLRPDTLLLIIVPLALVLAIGVETLVRQWYDLFPRNPYARIAALIPLTILIASTVGINMERYFYGHHYNPPQGIYLSELPAVRTELATSTKTNQNYIIIVPRNQVAFYDLLRREYPNITITSDTKYVPGNAIVFASVGAASENFSLPQRIVTTDLSENSVLLRFYSAR